MTWWSHLSALGGLDITVPVAFGVTAWLAGARGWRLALAWLLLFGASLAIAALSQMAFIGWGLGIASLSFTGFSGHAMRAAAVYPVALFLLAHQTGGWRQRALVLAGALLAVGVAAARVQVGAHTPSEVVAGCLLGLGTAALFIAHARAARPATRKPWPLLIGLLAAAVLLPRAGAFDSHQWLTAVALKLSGHDRIYLRAEWERAAGPYVPPCAPERVRFDYLCT
jgi:membrane-associated phospholipid phosphatase